MTETTQCHTEQYKHSFLPGNCHCLEPLRQQHRPLRQCWVFQVTNILHKLDFFNNKQQRLSFYKAFEGAGACRAYNRPVPKTYPSKQQKIRPTKLQDIAVKNVTNRQTA